MYENLKKLRLDHGLKQAEFGELFGLAKSTYQGYESGDRQADPAFWTAVADHFKVSTDFLLGQTDDRTGTKYGAKSDLDKKYEALDEQSKKLVDLVMEFEAERFAREVLTPPLREMRTIPLFCAAAGPGEPVAQSPFEEYEIPEWKKADFAVKISGDSMEPELRDGDVVLCLKRRPDDGELAVIMVNGFLLVKQYITDGINIYLRSLNRKRKNLDVDIWASGNDTVVGYGTVIHKRLPLVIE